VERRKEPRLKPAQPLQVTVLGLGQPPVAGTVVDMSGKGLRLRLPFAVSCGSPIKVEAPELMLLGEVCHCQPDQEGFTVGLMVLHSLTALSDLEEMRRSLSRRTESAIMER
jgi:hypothetical protein